MSILVLMNSTTTAKARQAAPVAFVPVKIERVIAPGHYTDPSIAKLCEAIERMHGSK